MNQVRITKTCRTRVAKLAIFVAKQEEKKQLLQTKIQAAILKKRNTKAMLKLADVDANPKF